MEEKKTVKDFFKKMFGWLNFKKYNQEIEELENRTSFVEEEEIEEPSDKTETETPLYEPSPDEIIEEGEFSENKRFKKKADKVRGINFVSLPMLLKRDCDKKYTYFDLLLHYLIAFLAVVVLGWIFKLKLTAIIVLCIVYFIFGPSFIYYHYRKKYEERLFASCVRYIEQMLYSFTRKSKILTALEECRLVVGLDGNLGKAIDFAINKIRHGTSEKTDIYSAALKEVEAILPCSRVKNLHEFLAEVENVGGKHMTALDIMVDDVREWNVRTGQFQKNQKVKGTGMLFSILMSLGTCLFMSNILPADMGGDISGFGLYQWITTIAIIVMFLMYRLSERKLTRSWVADEQEVDQDQLDADYEKIRVYYEEKEQKGVKPFLAISRVEKELEKKFPRWVMRFALLASSQSIPSALRNSISSCPNVMRHELEKLVLAIDKDPTGIEPYLNFFGYVDVPQVRSMMLMVYSLSEYGSDEIDKHILSIVKLNYALQATSETIMNEEKLARYSLYVTAPMIFACVVMMVDVGMIVFNMIDTVATQISF